IINSPQVAKYEINGIKLPAIESLKNERDNPQKLIIQRQELSPTQKEAAGARYGANIPGYQGAIAGAQEEAKLGHGMTEKAFDVVAKRLDEGNAPAQAAVNGVKSIHLMREQLDAPGGMFTGAGANQLLAINKALVAVKAGGDINKIVNTEAFNSASGQQVM